MGPASRYLFPHRLFSDAGPWTSLAVALVSCYKPRIRGCVRSEGFSDGGGGVTSEPTRTGGGLRAWGKLASSVPAGLYVRTLLGVALCVPAPTRSGAR
jgi:hypothetical protein